MTSEQERWAEALAIQRVHGDGAAMWIAERIGAFALAGEWGGVKRFREIAGYLGRLANPDHVQ